MLFVDSGSSLIRLESGILFTMLSPVTVKLLTAALNSKVEGSVDGPVKKIRH